jgi:hypothetical protein
MRNLSKIVKKFKALAVTYDATNIDWFIEEEDYTKEPIYDKGGQERKNFHDVYMTINKIGLDKFEEDDEVLKDLSALRAGDTLLVNGLVLPGYKNDFYYSEKEQLKIKSVKISRNSNNLYDVVIEIAPLEILYKQAQEDDDGDMMYEEMKDRDNGIY